MNNGFVKHKQARPSDSISDLEANIEECPATWNEFKRLCKLPRVLLDR